MKKPENGRVTQEIWSLCRPCAESAGDRYDLRARPGKSEKITCAICGRRRYGIAYEVRRKGGTK